MPFTSPSGAPLQGNAAGVTIAVVVTVAAVLLVGASELPKIDDRAKAPLQAEKRSKYVRVKRIIIHGSTASEVAA